MIEIPRYRMTNNFCHQDNNNGSWVRYADHVEQVERSLAKGYEAGFLNGEKYASTGKLHIPPLMLEPTPAEPKFKVGDRVTHRDGSIGVVKFVNLFEHGTSFDVQWHTPLEIGGTHPGKNLTLYTPPTPAELIPTLKEHEWVRGTYKSTGIAFGPYTVYYNEIGAMFAGDNHLIHWNTGKISDELATLERCDAPVVK